MIYNFNHGMGWASSGVEYAQAYRASILRRIGKEAKFVFTDMFPYENIEHLSANLGFEDNEVIWLYTFFTDNKIAPTTYTLDELKKSFVEETEFTRDGKTCKFIMPGKGNYYTAYMVDEDSDFVHRVEIVKDGCLIRKDYYNYCRMYSEYYSPANEEAHLYQRNYYNEDGSLAYEELVDGDSVMYKFRDRVLYCKEELIGYLAEKLNFTSDDVVIIDRTAEIGQMVLRNARDARVGVVIHADHFHEGTLDDDTILWNNYYEYAFSQHENIDFYLSATDYQSNLFRDQFKKYIGADVNAVTIPVGSIDELKYASEPRKKHGLITASRLASEKHVDWIASAVVKVHEIYPDVTLDIYGKGPEADKIKTVIDRNQAGDYIKLKGHHRLDEVYIKYEGYVSASTGEGFGLTLLEAVASGVPLIGFDVRYGNPTFIEEGANGFLLGYNEKMSSQEKIDALAGAIIKLFEADFEQFSEKSYEIASGYMTEEVEKAWIQLLDQK